MPDRAETGQPDSGQPAAGSFWPVLLAIALAGAPLYWGALGAFPLYDDGWLLMIIREGAPGQLAASMPDRPLFGFLLAFLTQILGGSAGLFVLVAIVLSAAYALEVGLLWRWIFPDEKQSAALASALAMSTVLVQAQLCTLLVTLPCLLPSIAVMGALLLLLRGLPAGQRAWIIHATIAAALTVFGVLFSEYAIAAAASILMLLGGAYLQTQDAPARRRLLHAVVILAIAVAVSYLLFLRMTNLSVSRPSVSPNAAGGVLRKNPAGVVVNLFNGVWYAIFGAFTRSAAQVALDWTSRFTIAATAYGALAALLLSRLLSGTSAPGRPRLRHASLPLAVCAGLLPVALMGRGTALTGFGSRFLVPVVPAASIITVLLLLHLVRARWTRVAVAAITFTAAHASFSTAVSERRDARSLVPIGDRLAAYVSEGPGFTVAIASHAGMDYEMTARLSQRWPRPLAEKFWMYDFEQGQPLYGPRQACRPSPIIDKEVRSLRRAGTVHSLLWVETRQGQLITIEPYCQGYAK